MFKKIVCFVSVIALIGGITYGDFDIDLEDDGVSYHIESGYNICDRDDDIGDVW